MQQHVTKLHLSEKTEARSGRHEFCVFLGVTAYHKHEKERQDDESIDGKEGEILSQSGRRPKATKNVLHVEPTNISEALNMNSIRAGRKRGEKVKGRQRDEEQKKR